MQQQGLFFRMGEGGGGRRLRLRPSFRLGESSSSERGASAPEGEPLARRGVNRIFNDGSTRLSHFKEWSYFTYVPSNIGRESFGIIL